MRLIDANALMKAFRDYMAKHHDRERCISQENCNACKVGCLWHRIVKEAPTIDPESLRPQGEWVETDYKPYWYTKCSLCGHRIMLADKSHHNYCPNCGAKMKGGTHER